MKTLLLYVFYFLSVIGGSVTDLPRHEFRRHVVASLTSIVVGAVVPLVVGSLLPQWFAVVAWVVYAVGLLVFVEKRRIGDNPTSLEGHAVSAVVDFVAEFCSFYTLMCIAITVMVALR